MSDTFAHAAKLTAREWVNELANASLSTDSQSILSFPDAATQRLTNGKSGQLTMQKALPCYLECYQFLLNEVSGLSGKKFLDFGCGWGRFSRLFMQIIKPENIYGVDVDRELVESCKKHLNNDRFRLFEAGDPIPFRDNYFDVFFSNSVFSHIGLELHNRSMHELARVSKVGATGIVTAMGERQLEEIIGNKNSKLIKKIGDVSVVRDKLKNGEVVSIPYHERWIDYGLIFFPKDFLEELWSPSFKVVGKSENYAQDIYFLKRV